MKNLVAITIITFSVFFQTKAQNFDVTKATADPFTFIFNDGTNTVQGYIYAALESKTKCCGNDAVYLEIKIDPNGSVIAAKALTGKNDCYKKSIIDIVKHIKWNTTAIKSPKSVYLELKPILACNNSAGENVYVPIGPPTIVASNNTNTQTNNVVKNDESKNNVNNANNVNIANNELKSDTSAGFAKPLPKPKYVSTGEKKPDESHIKSKLDAPGPMFTLPTYKAGETGMAIYVKSNLRKAGICGLAHVLAEIEVAKDGTVKGFRIFNANSEEVLKVVGPIISGLQYNSLPMNQITYFEFKADIDCSGQSEAKIDLTQVPDFLKAD